MPDPLAPTFSDYQEQALLHLQAIETYTQSLTKLIPEEGAAIRDTFKEFYIQQVSPTASVNVGATPQAVQTAALQRALAAPRQAGPNGLPANRGGSEWGEAESGVYGGGQPRGGRPSSNASVGGQGWLGNVTSTLGNSWIPHIQGAVITPADQLNFFASMAANMANKKRAPTQAAFNQLDRIPSGQITPEQATQWKDLYDQLNTGDMMGGRAGSISHNLSQLAGGYTQGKYISASLKTIFDPIAGARNLGYQTGYQGDQPGFLGIRMPWDGGASAGAGQYLSSLGFAFNNSVTPGQAHTIYSNLFSNGWLGGAQTNQMRDAAAQIMRTNPYIGSQPDTYAMMDQATRMGVTSLQSFVDTMNGVPDASKAANTSIAQTMSDMQAIGSIVRTQGSTVQQGYNLNNAWQSITGLPGAVLAPALTNPMVQAQTYMNTGLMPNQQGLAGAGSRIGAVMQTINRMYNTVLPQGTKHVAGPDGFSQSISPQDQKFALMAQFFPGWDSSTLKKIYKNQSQITAGSNLQSAVDDWQQMADGRHGNTRKLNALLGLGPKRDWGAILGNLRQAQYIGQDGNLRKMFSAKQIEGLQGIRNRDIQNWEDAHGSRVYRPYGRNGGAWVTTPQALKGKELPAKLAQQIIADRRKTLDADMAHNSRGQSNPGNTVVTIKFSGAAQKLLNFSSPQGQGKGQANAGQININAPYAGGWTQPPTSDMNTYGYGQESYLPNTFPQGAPASGQ